jgi:hypothetical protein
MVAAYQDAPMAIYFTIPQPQAHFALNVKMATPNYKMAAVALGAVKDQELNALDMILGTIVYSASLDSLLILMDVVFLFVKEIMLKVT